MGELGRHQPKSLILIALWQDHRAALQYDWIRAWRQPLDLTRTSVHEAWPMLREILKDHSSHSYAALAGWSYVPDQTELLIHALNQGQAKHRRITPEWEKPDTILGPDSTRPHTKPKRDERLRSRLKQRLGIPQ